MSAPDRRREERAVSELSVVLRPTGGGRPLDLRSMAHDVSLFGFQAETQVALEQGQELAFELELFDGARARGTGRVVWVRRDPGAFWAGVEIVSLPRADKTRLTRVLYPRRLRWESALDMVFKLLFIVVLTFAAQRIVTRRPGVRAFLWKMTPSLIAVAAMGWALNGLLRPRR